MAWTQSDIDAIDVALKNVTLRVRYADREVEYRSTDDMLKVRAIAVNQVARTGTQIIRQLRVETTKGW